MVSDLDYIEDAGIDRADFAREWANAAYDKGETQIFYSESSSGSAASGGAPSRSCWKSADTLELSGRARTTACNLHPDRF